MVECECCKGCIQSGNRNVLIDTWWNVNDKMVTYLADAVGF